LWLQEELPGEMITDSDPRKTFLKGLSFGQSITWQEKLFSIAKKFITTNMQIIFSGKR